MESDGLAAALAQARRRAAPRAPQAIAFEAAGEPRLRPGIDEEVFRIAQEALHNALAHAARRAGSSCAWTSARDGLRLTVTDDGVGFDPGEPALPLAAARADLDGGARAGARRASCGSSPSPGAGTTIGLEVPLTAIRVLVADDHAVVRQGLRTFLELQDDIEVVADVADGERRAARRWPSTTPTSC